jgi:hypothetical protein
MSAKCHNRPYTKYTKFRTPSTSHWLFWPARFVTAQTGGNITFNLQFLQGEPVNLNEGI